jgi:N-alpha-acetyltransferase 15/16, NatA auxiliary subunit
MLHVQLVRFRLALNSLSEPLPEKISDVILKEFEAILPKSTNLEEWNNSYLASHKGSVDHVRAALSTRLLLTPAAKPDCEKEFVSTVDLESTTLESAILGLETLDEWKSDAAVKDAYKAKAHAKWKEASSFI